MNIIKKKLKLFLLFALSNSTENHKNFFSFDESNITFGDDYYNEIFQENEDINKIFNKTTNFNNIIGLVLLKNKEKVILPQNISLEILKFLNLEELKCILDLDFIKNKIVNQNINNIKHIYIYYMVNPNIFNTLKIKINSYNNINDPSLQEKIKVLKYKKNMEKILKLERKTEYLQKKLVDTLIIRNDTAKLDVPCFLNELDLTNIKEIIFEETRFILGTVGELLQEKFLNNFFNYFQTNYNFFKNCKIEKYTINFSQLKHLNEVDLNEVMVLLNNFFINFNIRILQESKYQNYFTLEVNEIENISYRYSKTFKENIINNIDLPQEVKIQKEEKEKYIKLDSYLKNINDFMKSENNKSNFEDINIESEIQIFKDDYKYSEKLISEIDLTYKEIKEDVSDNKQKIKDFLKKLSIIVKNEENSIKNIINQNLKEIFEKNEQNIFEYEINETEEHLKPFKKKFEENFDYRDLSYKIKKLYSISNDEKNHYLNKKIIINIEKKIKNMKEYEDLSELKYEKMKEN
jgi:hypothetical protein